MQKGNLHPAVRRAKRCGFGLPTKTMAVFGHLRPKRTADATHMRRLTTGDRRIAVYTSPSIAEMASDVRIEDGEMMSKSPHLGMTRSKAWRSNAITCRLQYYKGNASTRWEMLQCTLQAWLFATINSVKRSSLLELESR